MPRRRLKPKATSSSPAQNLLTSLREIASPTFTIVTTINLLIMVAYYLMFVTSTQYILATYQTSLSTAGFTAGIMVIGCLAGRFLGGHFISLFGIKPLFLGGLVLYALSLVLFLCIDSLAAVFVTRFVTGFGLGLAGTATGTLIAYIVPKEHKGFGISVFSMSTALSLGLGPFLGILLINNFAYHTIISLCLVTIVLCIVLACTLRALPNVLHKNRDLFSLKSYIDPRAVRFSLLILILFMAYGCIQAFMSTYATERGLTTASSFFFLFFALAALASRPFCGRTLDQRGENILLLPLITLTAVAILLFAYAHSNFTLLLSAVLMGISLGNIQPIGQSIVLYMVTPSRFAQATTTYFIFMDLGIGIGPYLFGFLVPSIGFSGLYITLSALSVACLILYWFLHGRLVRWH